MADTEIRTSKFLRPGEIYSREELRQAFRIGDATLNNGIFRPKGHLSVWLFVTERKTPDRTPYKDRLEDAKLYMDGQTRGRTDGFVIEHRERGLELLLFYREEKNQYPRAAFRFEGIFRYISHSGAKPAHFCLTRLQSS
jgi:putative restriction endonuclease